MSRARYKRKPRPNTEVELKMAAMLDMAFQLLAFFILTFKPSPVESQISLRMPPNKPVTQSTGQQQESPTDVLTEDFGLMLPLKLFSTTEGRFAQVAIGDQVLRDDNPDALAQAMRQRLPAILGGGLYEGVDIQVGADLQYERLLDVLDLCSQQKLPGGEPITKISIGPLN